MTTQSLKVLKSSIGFDHDIQLISLYYLYQNSVVYL